MWAAREPLNRASFLLPNVRTIPSSSSPRCLAYFCTRSHPHASASPSFFLLLLLLLLQVQDADLEPMLGPSEAEPKLTFFVDTIGREFGHADDDTTGFWDRNTDDYAGP